MNQASTSGARQRGRVKFFKTDKGYGFISPDNGGEDHFIHVSQLATSGLDFLATGELVEYSLGTDQRSGRTRAQELKIIEDAA